MGIFCLMRTSVKFINPLSDMPILGSSNSAANKDNYAVKNMNK